MVEETTFQDSRRDRKPVLSDERLEITDVVVRRNGKFLVVTNRNHDGYTCPGGKLEANESGGHAAVRELREEVGLDVAMDDLIYHGTFDFRWRGKPLRCFSFEAEEKHWEGQEPRAAEEGTEIKWVDRDDLLDDPDCLSPAFYGWLMAKTGW